MPIGWPASSIRCSPVRRVRRSGDAWLGALAYTFQIYFDFSAYSDMAIGLGLMLGLQLPEEFQRAVSRDSDHANSGGAGT